MKQKFSVNFSKEIGTIVEIQQMQICLMICQQQHQFYRSV